MADKSYPSLLHSLLVVALLMTLSGCGPLIQEQNKRFFWPPPPAAAKIEYINYYFADADLQRGVDRRLEYAILGRTPPKRLIFQPYSVASDGQGRIFIVDFSGGIVHVFDRTNHEYRQLVAGVTSVQKVQVDSRGEIWVLNSKDGVLLHFAADESSLAEVTLPGTLRAASFAVDRQRDRIYVVDSPQHQLRIYDLKGHFLETLGKRGNGPAEFNYPVDIDLDSDGNLYIVDAMNSRIQILAADGTHRQTFGDRGTGRASFSAPKGIAVSPSGPIYVSDANQHKIVIFNREGDYLLTLGARNVYKGEGIAPGGFYFPAGLDVDASDTLWVADLMNGIVHEFQYLTPEFLAKNPIREVDIYRPQASDFNPPDEEEDALLPAPID